MHSNKYKHPLYWFNGSWDSLWNVRILWRNKSWLNQWPCAKCKVIYSVVLRVIVPTVPTARPSVTVTSTTNSLEFTWSEVSCGSRGGLILKYHYRLHKQDVNTVITNQHTPDATKMSVNMQGLETGQVYEFQVAAVNSAGTGHFTVVTASTIAGSQTFQYHALNLLFYAACSSKMCW